MQFALAISFAVAFAAAIESSAAATEDNLQKAFTVSPGGKLVVDANAGSIQIKTAPANQVSVEVFRKITVRGRAGVRDEEREREVLQANEITFSQDGNTVTVSSKSRNRWNFSHNSSMDFEVRYIISTPKKFNVDLKTAGGGIRVEDLTGDVKTRTSGGGLKFANVRGPIDGHTSGGGITLAKCVGTVKVDTSGGGIDMADGNGNASLESSGGSIRVNSHEGDVRAHTSGGGIKIEQIKGKIDASTSGGSVSATLAAQPSGDCRLETSAGGITVKLPETLALDIDASTSGGSVHTDFPVTTMGELKRGRLKGKMNGGGSALVLHTSGGSIHLQKL